jgi:hypothetical protein
MVRALRRRKEAARPPACSKWTGPQVTGLSEIPCRVIQLELPGSEVIPDGKPANNGEALLVCGVQGSRRSEWVIPWEVGSVLARSYGA